MRCIICDSPSYYYFSKEYTEPPFCDLMKDIGSVNYFKCSKCGFVISETHRNLTHTAWQNLNHRFHHYHESNIIDDDINQPPYAEQAMMIAFLGKNGLIDTHSMIDFAGGYGTLSNVLERYHNISLPIFDPYIYGDKTVRYINGNGLTRYNTVINSAMFEHVLVRQDLEQLNNITTPTGCLIIHTVVCENIPNDPDWFYLRPPVHTAFHTNKSMNILMEQWGYQSSIYSPKSKCWVLFHEPVIQIKKSIDSINNELQTNWFHYKNGFVDYWK